MWRSYQYYSQGEKQNTENVRKCYLLSLAEWSRLACWEKAWRPLCKSSRRVINQTCCYISSEFETVVSLCSVVTMLCFKVFSNGWIMVFTYALMYSVFCHITPALRQLHQPVDIHFWLFDDIIKMAFANSPSKIALIPQFDCLALEACWYIPWTSGTHVVHPLGIHQRKERWFPPFWCGVKWN